MSNKRYTQEFKDEAVKQVTQRGHAVSEVASRLGVSAWSLHQWLKVQRQPASVRIESQAQSAEVKRLKAELRRVTEERDILKKAAAYFAKQSG
jgi:transposase